MSVLSDILTWSRSRPMWQRDALRRLVQSGQLTENDISEITRLGRTEHGLTSPDLPAVVPQPLTRGHIPGTVEAGNSVRLLGIRDVHSVNALIEGQKLGFGSEGITVIYGNNGAGKSGYARILKRVCRARSRDQTILPNIYDTSPVAPASASIDYRVGGSDRSLGYQEGQTPPSDLSAVSFFDKDCAVVHIGQANDVAYTPFGLDILEKLATLCLSVRDLLQTERSALATLRPQSLQEPQAAEGTGVRIRLDSLTPESDLAELEALGVLTDQERNEIVDIRRALADDPARTAQELRLRVERVRRLYDLVGTVSRIFSEANLTSLKDKLKDASAKAQAVKLAARLAFSDQPLPDVGSATWKALWEAARQFSTSEAYPAEEFPVTRPGARCVLCQQELGAEAVSRLNRFEEFIRGNAERAADSARRLLEADLQHVQSATLRRRDSKDALGDISLLDRQLESDVRRYLVKARLLRRRIRMACATGTWVELPGLPDSPAMRLGSVIQSLGERITRLANASTSEERAKLRATLQELEARQWLATVLDDVRTEVARLKMRRSLDSAIASADTTAITHKSTSLTRAYITRALRNRFVQEVKRLGAGYVPVELVSAGGRYGTHRFQVRLRAARDADVPQVLSDGEFNCIALAGFLAELSTAPSLSALIFDDPVSSLDHGWRRKVAERLAEEAACRQVIIFTHDVVFLMNLMECCESGRVPIYQCHIDRDAQGVGICLDGVPWIAMTVRERIGRLKGWLQEAKSVFNKQGQSEYEGYARRIYGRLRATWERAVEEILLNKVVQRFGRTIQTQRLDPLVDITEGDIRAIGQPMSKCSMYLEGHDEAAAINEPVPHPDELARDIAALEQWVLEMRKRGRN